MGITERRERQKTELRNAILEAAEKTIVEEGFDALTMRKLAEAVEYSPAAIYQYFENRDAIAKAVVMRGFMALLEYFAPLGQIENPEERLTEIGRAYVRFGLENPQTYRLIFMEKQGFADVVFPPDELKEPDDPGDRAFRALAGTVEELQRLGRVRTDIPATTIADMLWSGVHGIVSLKLSCPQFPETPAETLADYLQETMMRGLRP